MPHKNIRFLRSHYVTTYVLQKQCKQLIVIIYSYYACITFVYIFLGRNMRISK